MKIIVDIGHPAHVHLFKNMARNLLDKGHDVLFTLREKEKEIELLRSLGFQYKSFGRKYNSMAGKIFGMLKFDYLEWVTALKFKPDLFISHGSVYAAHAAALLRKPNIALEDTGNMEQIMLYRPFTKVIISPDIIGKNLGAKHLCYSGYHELAYLHPRYFTPNNSVYELLNIPSGSPYAILRFISWNATHDVGKKGLTIELKRELIEYLGKRMKVFVSSESKEENEFSQYRIKIPPERMHDALAFASIYVGEGTTMAAEAAILGTPSFYVSNVLGQNCEDLEKYGLGHVFMDGSGLLKKIDEVLKIPGIKDLMQQRKNRMLAEKIDITSFIIWFVENYPTSLGVLKEDKNYFRNFRQIAAEAVI
jgi:predicted glycosyltransferase